MFNCASISLLKYRYKLLEQNICAIHIGSLVRGKNYWGINITDLNEPILVIMSKSHFVLLITLWITNKFISFKSFLLNIKLPILESGDILPLF